MHVSRSGLFAGEGEPWLRMKRFSLRQLRDIGFGRRSEEYETVLAEETRDLIAAIENECLKGRSVLIPDIFYPALFNCIFHLMIGQRYPVKEHEKLTVCVPSLRTFLVHFPNFTTLTFLPVAENRKSRDKVHHLE